MRALLMLLVLAGSASIGPASIGPAAAASHDYVLPEETATFAPGPNLETVQQNCAACHSADYVGTQPRPLANARGFWQAEVVKMRAAYGAPIADDDVPKIVEYLAETYK